MPSGPSRDVRPLTAAPIRQGRRIGAMLVAMPDATGTARPTRVVEQPGGDRRPAFPVDRREKGHS